jgi:RNA polymerase sigma factor (sigma-70 family)
MTDTRKLLADYVKNGSETAFRELVMRYIDFVYSAAVRLTGDDMHLAEDVTQTVFIHLARNAQRLPHDVMLGGWLHQDACYSAAKMLRGERRRRERERQAMEINAPDHTQANLAHVAPMLDDAINQLGVEDRTAILLRFFERCDFREVGEALGSNEDAAQKRVSRALERLHVLLNRRGVRLSAAALGTALAAQPLTAAPVGLSATIIGTALASAAGSGTILSFLRIIAMTNQQAGVVGGLVLICGLGFGLFSQHQKLLHLQAENRALQEQTNTLSQLKEENAKMASLKVDADEMDRLRRENQELLRLRGEVGRLRRDQSEVQGQLAEARSATTNAIQELMMPALANVASNLIIESSSGFYPTNFDEVKAKIAQEILKQHDWTNAEVLGLDRFEFVPYEKPLPKDSYGILLLRERVPRRRATDGQWVRFYTYVGSVVGEGYSSDGNFEKYEREENQRRLGQGVGVKATP